MVVSIIKNLNMRKPLTSLYYQSTYLYHFHPFTYPKRYLVGNTVLT